MLKATIIGNLGSDRDMRYSAGGSPFLRFNVASNVRVRTPEGEWQDQTEWVRVTVFGQRAESLQNYLKKGSRVYVEGRLEARPWTDQLGQARAGLEVIANDVEFMSTQRGPDVEVSDLPASTPARAPRSARQMPEAVAVHGARPARSGAAVAERPDADLEDLPF
jgi:single-strand DNA-binding protein